MIITQNLHLSFSSPSGIRHILSDISLQISDGEYVALMGPNGSGKTSLARCLNGILLPTEGRVLIDGLDTDSPNDLLEIRRRLGMVFQNPDNQIVAPTVEREIAFGLENLGVPRAEMHRRVEAMLELFDLKRYRDHAPHQLSGGEKQRLALAGVMAMQPRHIVFDEPTSLLDYPSRVRLFKTIDNIRHVEDVNEKITVLVITQFAEEALLADRLLVLKEGKIIMDGAPMQLFQRVDDFKRIGLMPPLEFRLYQRLLAKGEDNVEIRDLLLSPVL